MNTLVSKLNEAGYLNKNSNRERAVKNLNMLIDSGIMDIKFINAEDYNNRENGRSYWFTTSDGKQRCTPYIITLYGKSYYGHFVPKAKTGVAFGERYEYEVENFHLDVNDIQLRVARLIRVLKEKGDFLKPEFMQAKGACSCYKCNGEGIIPQFAYYADGVCFDCGGSGISISTLKRYIKDSIEMAKKDIKE